jgi:hypothetical protein
MEIVERLEELRGLATLSASDKAEIETLYMAVLGKNFVKTSCNDCYRDAIIEMYLYLKRNGKMKEKCSYRLKNGVLLQTEFGGGDMYTNANLTDEVAEKYLAKNPKGVSFFEGMPSDWEDRVKKRVAPKTELNDELVTLAVEELSKEGATVDTVKEALKGYMIDGKKVTAKVLDKHIKAAQDSIAAKGE